MWQSVCACISRAAACGWWPTGLDILVYLCLGVCLGVEKTVFVTKYANGFNIDKAVTSDYQ